MAAHKYRPNTILHRSRFEKNCVGNSIWEGTTKMELAKMKNTENHLLFFSNMFSDLQICKDGLIGC